MSLHISFDCDREMKVSPFLGEDQNYIKILALLVSYRVWKKFGNTGKNKITFTPGGGFKPKFHNY